MKKITRLAGTTAVAAVLAISLSACGGAETSVDGGADQAADEVTVVTDEITDTTDDQTANDATVDGAADAAGDESATYTKRDMAQEADLTDATSIEVADGEDVGITEEGVYVLSGTASDVTVTVEVDSTDKVQLVLDGLTIENDDAPAIYVASADKVFVTTAEGSQNSLTVTGVFATDEENNYDAVIYAKDDLVLNGLGTLTIASSQNAIAAKDDLKVTGGTYQITCDDQAFDVNDSAYFHDGTVTVDAVNDAIRADELVQIDGGTFTLAAREGIESTYVLINDGTISINATDDGINAGQKVDSGTPTIEITSGNVTIVMAEGDTDAVDANGNIYVSGGTVDITAQSAFDFDGEAQLTGGTVIVNGEQVSAIENSMMMGGGMGGQGGMGGGPGMGGPGGR